MALTVVRNVGHNAVESSYTTVANYSAKNVIINYFLTILKKYLLTNI